MGMLTRVLETQSTAREAWCHIQTIFLNNKGLRVAALEHEFNNLTLKSMPSLEAYCQKVKELGDRLNDVDCPVNNQRLVLQLVRGLPAEYDTTTIYINQTLLTWETVVSMLELEHQRQIARETLSPPTAMATLHSAPSTLLNRRRQGNRHNGKRPNSQQSSTSSALRRNPVNPQPRSQHQQVQQAHA